MHGKAEPGASGHGFLTGGGMGALMRAHDWSTSPLGPPARWPQPLKTLVEVMLASNQPMFVVWGARRSLLYNDTYAEILAAKHPGALGRDFLDVWHEIRADLMPIVEAAYAGEPVHMDDIELVMLRKGYPEETHFAFSYTPVRDEGGTVAGFLCPCREITEQVFAERRQAFRLALEERLRDLADPGAVMDAAVTMLGEHLDADRVGYGQVLPDDATVRLSHCYANGAEPLYGDFPLDSFGAASIARQRRGQTEACGDVLSAPDQDPTVWAAIDTRAFVSVPLIRNGRFLASLYVNASEPRRWSSADIALIEDLAERTWDAVERARAEEALRQNEARLAFLDRLSAATAALSDADAVLAATTRLLGEHLNLSVCAYADMDADGDGFTIRGDWAAPGSRSIVGHYSLAAFGRLAVANLNAGLPLVINDNLHELAPEEAATFQAIGITATVCMPLVKDGRLTALMAIHDRAPRRWTEAELALMREVTARSWAHVERVGAVAELRASEERFRLTADAVPQIVWITDPDGRVEFFNKQWSDYTGAAYEPTTAAEVAASFVHPDDAEPTMISFEAARRTGGTFLVEHRIRSKSGEYRWFLVRGEPYRDTGSGRIVRWFGASVDIHDRRQTEAALRESEARLGRALDAGELGAWELDLATLAVWRSPQHDRVFGYGTMLPDWTYGMFLDHVVAEDRGYVDDRFRHAVTTRGRWEVECRIRRADGEERWIWAQGKVEADADGEPALMKGMVRDITERKYIEHRLRNLNETLESQVAARSAERDRLWNLSQDMLARADYHGMMSAVSPAWTQVLGWSETELLTRGYASFMHPDDMPSTLDAIGRMAETRRPSRLENRIATSDGGWKHIEWTVAPEPDGVNFIAVGRDLTLARAREAELSAAQEALRQAQKMEAVGQLTGGVAHDFNNLLTIIKSSTDLLRRPDLAAERRTRYVEAISDTVDRASKLTGQLLAFARRQALKPEVFDVRERIDAISDMLRTIVGSRVKLVEDVDCQPCFVEADTSQFETALVNMAVNARDAMDGEGTLTIVVRSLPGLPPMHGHAGRPWPHMELSITDTGTGIPPDQLAQIFEPFFTTKEVGKGTGLGLSQVYGFVKQSGGDVAVESELGHGASFKLYLPLVEAPAPGAPDRPGAQGDRPTGQGQRLLVVEDNPEVGRFSTQLLQDLGYETTWAANAGEALEILRERSGGFDAVFSDVVMPGMSGVEFGHEVRRLYPGLPVLLTSGYSHVLAEEGPQGFELLHKPYAVEELSRVLRHAITSDRRGLNRGKP